VLYPSRSGAADESNLLHPEGLGLRKAALVSIFAGLISLPGLTAPVRGQETGGFGGVRSFGLSTTYAADSSHILIGESQQRRIWTIGVDYSRRLHQSPHFRLDYEGSILPVYEERDPTVTGTVFTVGGTPIVTPQAPVRVVSVTRDPVGSILTGSGATVPLYALFGTENTYAAAVTPLGARVSAMPHWRVQPSAALDVGFVFSSRDIPIDDSARFNYTIAFGPGVQFFADHHTSWRVEYIYRHVSNAGQGTQNPGVDQGVLRVTVSLHR
jgi:Lipid A 3-O-deacylase (PagL)